MLLKNKQKSNLMLLIFSVMISWSSFSQTDTEIDSSKTIQLTNPIARLVVKDLIKGDAASDEVKAMQKILSATNDKLLTQSDLVTNLKMQVSTYTGIISQKDEQFKTQQELSKDLEKALKKANRTKKIYQIGSAIGAAAILLNVLGK
jgi:hypothetical protein